MATTYIKAIHRSNSGSAASALSTTINYDENPGKTNGGQLVYGYECNPQMAAAEFLLTKVQYEQSTGRDQGKGRDYAEYMADRKPPSARETLCDLIDANLVVGQSFGEFLAKREFYDAHTADIILHRAAKKYFDSQTLGGKLPPIATLKQEWAKLESQRKLAYKDYYALKQRNKELQTALMNVNEILHGHTPQEQEWSVPKKSHDHDTI